MDELNGVTGTREVWGSLVRLLDLKPDCGCGGRGWMDGSLCVGIVNVFKNP